MRNGPHPLTVQIALAATLPEGRRMPGLQAGPDAEAVVSKRMEKMLLGIQRYQNHPYKVEREPLQKIWGEGTASLQVLPPGADVGKAKAGREVLLLVPSMVNRGYILDLCAERSMLRWLAAQGLEVLLLDWGEGTQDDGQQTIEGIVLQRLVPAIEFAVQKYGCRVHVLGYCMGGTLVAGAAQQAAESIASLIFLAAPWDFHAGTKNMLNRVKFWAPSAFPAIAEKGVLPMDWMQTLFASLEPESAANKFAGFLEMEEGSPAQRLFIAVEDWLNDGVDLPGDVAEQCIKEWFFENAPAAQKWELAGHLVNPAALDVPALVIASRRDRLVDYGMAAALAAGMKKSEILDAGTGHIGMIAGSKAVEKVWKPIAEWIKAHPA